MADRVDIRVEDYRRLSGEPFDAVASIGMVEHVGNVQIDTYARQVARLVKPGGRVLNHGIARLRHGDPEAGAFSERYVFPDAAPLHLSRIVLALERAGLPVEHVEGLAADYAETLRHWARRFDEHLEDAVRLGGAERVRIWRVYLRAARRWIREQVHLGVSGALHAPDYHLICVGRQPAQPTRRRLPAKACVQ